MFSRAYNRYALAVMTALYMLNVADRSLMIVLLEPIKRDLHLSDTQLGFLTGIAFGLFYATLGLPVARWADRGNRATIASLAIGLWGVTVMACLAVTTYAQLVIARVAAAVGEAGGKPPTYSLVGDYFPEPRERTRAMAVYLSGNSLSSLVSLILGGWLNERYGWRVAFFFIGGLGLVLAPVVKMTLIEPRTRMAGQRTNLPPLPPMRSVLAALWERRSLRHLGLALILLYTMGLGLGPWYGAFLIRSHGMRTVELGVWLGLMFGIGGVVGVLSGGYVAGRWFADNERGQMRLTAGAVASLVPCFVAFLTLPGKVPALAALLPLIVALSFFWAPTYALMQRLVPDEMRATMMAVVMLLANLIGMGLGPQLVGILSDQLLPNYGTDSLRYAMLIMSLVALWAAYHFWRVGLTVRDDLALMVSMPRDNGGARVTA
jgi:predicted MFS family arabinose efflux permease